MGCPTAIIQNYSREEIFGLYSTNIPFDTTSNGTFKLSFYNFTRLRHSAHTHAHTQQHTDPPICKFMLSQTYIHTHSHPYIHTKMLQRCTCIINNFIIDHKLFILGLTFSDRFAKLPLVNLNMKQAEHFGWIRPS